MNSLDIVRKAYSVLDAKKAEDIRVLKVKDITVLADYFVIASGTSSTHVGSLANEVDDKLTKAGAEMRRTEGNKSKDWVLLDFGSVIIHVFYPEAREHYALERLWADADEIAIDTL